MRYWRKEGELGPWAVQQEYDVKGTSPLSSIVCLLDSSQVFTPTGLQTYNTLRCCEMERSHLTAACEGVKECSTASSTVFPDVADPMTELSTKVLGNS